MRQIYNFLKFLKIVGICFLVKQLKKNSNACDLLNIYYTLDTALASLHLLHLNLPTTLQRK